MPDTHPLRERLKDYDELEETREQTLERLAHAREEAIKEALKHAIKEWMDDKFAQVGKWTVRGIAVAALGALTYFILHFGGKP